MDEMREVCTASEEANGNQLSIQPVHNQEMKLVQHSGFIENFREAYKLANVFSSSSLVPSEYQGKPGDCAIAIEMADRMGVSPLMVMQNLYVVKGKPSWSGKACIAFIKARYSEAAPVYFGELGTDGRGCYVRALTQDGETINGVAVTISMAKKEGWYGKTGSKWQTMPELMLAYRAAAFFARVYCPEVLMGIAVQGEVEDTEKETQRVPDPFSGSSE